MTEALRREYAALLDGLGRRELPPGAYEAVARIVEVLGRVLDRLDEVADDPADRAAAPDRLARAADIVRDDLPACVAAHRNRSREAQQRAEAELAAQLGLVAQAADRLATEVPDVHVQRAEDLTEELRRRYGDG